MSQCFILFFSFIVSLHDLFASKHIFLDMSPIHSPPEPPSVYCTPSPQSKATTPSPLARISMSRQQSFLKPSIKHVLSKHHSFNITTPHIFSRKYPHDHATKASNLLSLTRHRHTHPAVWFTAIICLIFILLINLLVIAILIIYLVVKPKIPVLDTSHATLNVVYFDSPGHLNGDLSFVANISNPNKKLDLKYEHAVMELFFEDDVIASQSIRPFSQRRKETGVVGFRFISSSVSLPPNHAMELERQVLSNKVYYSVRGTFKVRASFGGLHFTYWLHGECDLQMSSPPSGSLMGRTCKTKRR